MAEPGDYERIQRWWTTSDGSVFLPTYTDSTTSTNAPPPTTTVNSITTSDPGSTETGTTGGVGGGSNTSQGTGSGTDSYSGSTQPQSSSFPSSSGAASGSQSSVPVTTVPFTSMSSTTIPITVTFPSTTVTSASINAKPIQQFSTSYSGLAGQPTGANNVRTICVGDGLDSTAIGVLATLLFSAVVGLLIWVSGLALPSYTGGMLIDACVVTHI